MNNVTFDTKEVEITSVFFRHNDDQVRFESYPRQINYQGRTYILAD